MTSVFLALRCAVGIIWIVAGAAKIGKQRELSSTLSAYRIVPTRLIDPVARVLPVGELILGVALAFGVLPEVSGLLAACAFAVFAAAMAWNLANGRHFDCGCGISRDTAISWRLVGRNVTLAAVAAAIAIGPSGGLALVRGGTSLGDSPGNASLIAIPMVVVLLAAMLRVVVTVDFDLLMRLNDERVRDPSSLEVVLVDRNTTTIAGSN